MHSGWRTGKPYIVFFFPYSAERAGMEGDSEISTSVEQGRLGNLSGFFFYCCYLRVCISWEMWNGAVDVEMGSQIEIIHSDVVYAFALAVVL